MKYQDQVVLVTGAGGGSGQAIAKAFLAVGATVAAADLRRPEWDAGEAEERLLRLTLDVSDEARVESVIAEVNARTTGINVLVNNAGIALELPIQDTTLEDWNRVLGVNATGAFLCCRAVARDMLKRGLSGAIVNISSIAGRNSFANSTAYAASKAAIIGMTRSLALELGPHDITVNSICPGSVDTPMIQTVIQTISRNTGMSLEDTRRMMESGIPMGRFQQPEDLAGLVLFLSSPQARNLSGETINLDGGVVRN